jgi:hypothetical protein
MRKFKLFKVLLIIILIHISFKLILHNKKAQELTGKNEQKERLNNLRSLYLQKNSNFKLKNSKLFNFTSNEEVLVILIQVHNRSENLKILIESLRLTQSISSSIVIFSHDVIDSSIEKCLETIDFVAVKLFSFFIIKFLSFVGVIVLNYFSG